MTLTSVEDSSVFLDAFPVQMQNSALVLKDEGDGSVITELEGLSSSETSLTPAAINVENSSDVIIGPVTQFHGPVTIYQNVTPVPATERVTNGSANSFLNGKLVKSESTSSETTLHTEKPKRNFLLYSKHLRYVGIFLVLVIIVVSVASVIILSTKTETPPSTETIEPTDNRVTTRPFTGPLAIIPKTI